MSADEITAFSARIQRLEDHNKALMQVINLIVELLHQNGAVPRETIVAAIAEAEVGARRAGASPSALTFFKAVRTMIAMRPPDWPEPNTEPQ
jgi:hypothetical protein